MAEHRKMLSAAGCAGTPVVRAFTAEVMRNEKPDAVYGSRNAGSDASKCPDPEDSYRDTRQHNDW
jgi:hypothetical protein